MVQNGIYPLAASPAEKVTACCSVMPVSNTLSGNSFCMMSSEQPLSMAGVMPTIRGFSLAISQAVLPKTT